MLKRSLKPALPSLLACLILMPCRVAAQGASRAAYLPETEIAPPQATAAGNQPRQDHRFWDRTNLELFSGVAAVRALDYVSTRHFRARGANEILLSNAIVDNKPLFAAIEVASTAASMGVSYLFHRTGHHRIERWVSIVHIGVGVFGDARNFTLRGSGASP
jgi:hypothetical protein